ncbi:MAG: hypothetical protein ACRELD_00530 [Longimicrobiales bacterium]
MRLLASVVLLAALIAAVLVPLFIGHALSAHGTTWYLAAAACFGSAAALIVLFARLDRSPAPRGH